jgi:hypothetical protein
LGIDSPFSVGSVVADPVMRLIRIECRARVALKEKI